MMNDILDVPYDMDEEIEHLGDYIFEIKHYAVRYLFAASRQEFDASNKPDSHWNKKGNKDIMFEGLLGEAVFGYTIGQRPDISVGYKDIDFICEGKTIEVKNTKTDTSLLIRSVDERGYHISLKCDLYVSVSLLPTGKEFCSNSPLNVLNNNLKRYINVSSTPTGEEFSVRLRINGLAKREYLRNLKNSPAWGQKDWKNKEVPLNELIPFDRFLDVIDGIY